MKVDSVSSSSQAMSDILKLIASKSTEMNDKLLKVNIAEKVKVAPSDTLGQNIDTYA